ncbi:MAG: serine/threonine protein kinase [Chitinophagaceae bacterium]|nr:MAG: serine/threonine protein kinase [Chitinophagaceae bacterium]
MIGKTIQNYQMKSLLGEGGMGKVYLAIDTLLGRQVAIKNVNTNLTSQPLFLERFKNEAKTLARLAHPNIAIVYNYLQVNDNYFMVMEYVEGQNLDELLRKNGPLPFQIVVPIICATLEGLDHAHKRGILHRDLKPANIMLTNDPIVKLMDFGIAKVSDAAKLTQASRVIGTIEFLAPELIEGKEPSIASDIYALGITMYELLSGKLPFTGKSDYMLMKEIVKEKPIVLQKINTLIPKNLSDIVLKALEKKPEKRFLNATDFLQTLRNSFPELNKIDINFIHHSTPTTTLHLKEDALSPKATIILKDQRTNLASKPQSNAVKKSIDLMAVLKNKITYIIFVLLLILFALFKLFTSDKVTNDATDETTTSNGTNNVSDEHQNLLPTEQSISNTDSLMAIINNNKEESNTENTQQGQNSNNNSASTGNSSSNKKPEKVATENNEKNPKRPIDDEDANDKKPVPSSITEPIKLRVDATLALRENISPENAQDGQSVSFKVLQPVIIKGRTVIPSGAIIHGNIERLGKIRMDLRFNSVYFRGNSHALEGSRTSTNIKNALSSNSFKVGLRGTLQP